MEVSVKRLSNLERSVTVVVPVEKLDEALNKRLANLAKNAKIAGFRPGKAPLDVIKKRYGDSARQEALGDVIQSSFYAAIQQEKLKPVSTPKVEPKTIIPNQPLEFVATFEVMPEVDALHFNLKSLEKQIATITDADIEKVLEQLRAQRTQWNKVDRAAQDKDQAVIDFRGSIDGVVFQGGEAHDYPIVLGSKTMIPGFEEGVVGMKTGEEKTIKVTFPQDYFSKDVAGKEAEFAIKVISISQPNLPDLDEAFIKKMGIQSGELNDLRTEVKKNLERELDRVIKAKLKNQIFDALIEQNALEIPHSMIEREAGRIHDEVHPHHGEAHHHTDAEMAQFNDLAKRNVALGLLVAEVIKKHNLTVNKQRVQEHLAKLAAVYDNPAEVIAWYNSDKRAYAEAEMQVMEEQVVEKLLEQVDVKEKMLSYAELISR